MEFSIAVKVNLSFWSVPVLVIGMLSLLALSPAYVTAAPSNQPISGQQVEDYNWFRNSLSRSMAKEGLQFIADSAKHGLTPDNYHYQTLRSLTASANPQEQAQFNRLFTEALTTLSRDLKIGRTAPLTVDPDWHIPQVKFDENAFISHAIDSRHLIDHLDLLAPTTANYQKLMAAYARYQRYAQQGGWQTIPASPKLSPGDSHPTVLLIQSRLAVEDAFFAYTHAVPSTLYDPLMAHAVRRFQQRSGLKVDGIIGRNTLKTLNIPLESRLDQLKVNMERHRWMPRDLGKQHVFINLANYRLQAFEDGEERLTMNVIVGKKDRQTPSFSAQMSHMVFNPFWNVPSKLARLDLLPKQQQNPNYFYQQTIRVFTKIGGAKIELDPANINWQMHDTQTPLPFSFRQDPGKRNPLGRLKFMFKNPWQIYLHDTPTRSLFNKTKRALSSGCIRVADPVSLANFSLMGHKAYGTVIQRIESEHNHGILLDDPLNIFAVYFTVSFQDDHVLFLPDVYQRDQRMIKKLY